MSKNLSLSRLLDFYGELLSEPQREAAELFYNDDLSLSEIAELTGITRQGVRDRLVKAEQLLSELEGKLGLAARFDAIGQDVDCILARAKAIGRDCGVDVSEIIQAAERIGNR